MVSVNVSGAEGVGGGRTGRILNIFALSPFICVALVRWDGCKVKSARYTPHFIVSQRNLYFYLSVVVYSRMRVNEVELKRFKKQ